ncbi:hypothetical protein G7Y89_g11021 [Cudoniella acicularis]|uniref:Uncharacterized protein n=1 Tax=Cudoniella acicularis TaxID=354080 RepID=A0A8H4VY81_9HELO|nr:hypothetical protein G7Y89_g11021 [Cudoniella acicularis]
MKKLDVVLPPELGRTDNKYPAELEKPYAQISELSGETAVPKPQEKDSTEATPKILPPPPVIGENSDGVSISKSPIGPNPKLDLLKDKIEKVRTEKERIQKLQELDELEAALQREILDKQMRETRQ